MVHTEETPTAGNGETQSTGSLPHHITMPSARHSVLAKARRYREEPDRVEVLANEPFGPSCTASTRSMR
jgi:hypothetical protein